MAVAEYIASAVGYLNQARIGGHFTVGSKASTVNRSIAYGHADSTDS